MLSSNYNVSHGLTANQFKTSLISAGLTLATSLLSNEIISRYNSKSNTASRGE